MNAHWFVAAPLVVAVFLYALGPGAWAIGLTARWIPRFRRWLRVQIFWWFRLSRAERRRWRQERQARLDEVRSTARVLLQMGEILALISYIVGNAKRAQRFKAKGD